MSLLLLVHLYILNYPYVNNAEYDHDLFNPRTRGLRDRTKAMEDITYFLVGQIEGNPSKMLPTYPCRQPSDSLAFRTSLTKYLEQLRHPPRATANLGIHSSNLEAPWWRDVVVRKSLLDESVGEKFERLLLSLSTHALMKASHTIPQEAMIARLRSEPVSYYNALVRYQSIRESWSRLASSLLRRQGDLKSLRIKFQSQSIQKYKGLSTAHLTALARSKYQDLMSTCAEEACSFLAMFIELSGVFNSSDIAPLPRAIEAKCPSLLSEPLPLPIAAAHHPSYLKKFKHSLFRGSKLDTEASLSVRSHAKTVLAARIEAEKRIQQLLANALSRTENRRFELRKAITSISSQPSSNAVSTFLQPLPSTFDITYDPKPLKTLLISMGLGQDFDVLELDTETANELEKRVDKIRSSVLPPFPTFAPGPRITPMFPQFKTRTGDMRSTDSRIPRPQKHSSTSKKSIRGTRPKSVRFSTARRLTGRPSIFGAFDELDESINCLINQTHDFPTDDEDTDHEEIFFLSPYKTPNTKRKTPKVNRIWTPGTPLFKAKGFEGRIEKQRESEVRSLDRLFEDEPPAMELPGFGSFGTLAVSASNNSVIRDANENREYASTRAQVASEHDIDPDEDDYLANDPPSMTLKELLLTTDTSQFELLVESEDDRLEISFMKDQLSASWE